MTISTTHDPADQPPEATEPSDRPSTATRTTAQTQLTSHDSRSTTSVHTYASRSDGPQKQDKPDIDSLILNSLRSGGGRLMLTISSGHSADYLLNAVATGRENYYTGAVAEGEPPGRWYGAGAEELGLTGLVDAQDMNALYEHFLDPRDPNFRDPERWDEVATLGHTGRKYPTAEEIYQRSLDAEPYADAERREQLRLDASKKARKNVAFMDVTFSVQKSVTVLHAAFEAQEVKARKRRRRGGGRGVGAAPAGGRGRDLGRQQRRPSTTSPSTPATPGSATTAARPGGYIDAHDWTIASFFQHDSPQPRPAAAHPQRDPRTGCWAPTACGARWTGRSLYLHRPAAGAVAERTTEERLTSSLRVLRGDAPGRQGPRDRRHPRVGQRPVLLAPAGDHPEDRRAGRRVRDQARPRAERAGAGPAAAAGHVRHPPREVARRRDHRAAPGAGGPGAARRDRRRPRQARRRRARPRRTREPEPATLVAAGR